MEEHDRPRLTSGIWERALHHGDEMAEELIDRAIKALGAGIASAVNLLDPEIVILGGGLGVRFGEKLGPTIEAAHAAAPLRPRRTRPSSRSPSSATSAGRSAPRCWSPD